MGLLPIIGKALGLFSFLSFTALSISFVLYKMRSPKTKPYNRTAQNPYPVQQSYTPAFQAAYYQHQAAEMSQAPQVPAAPERMNVPERMDIPERRFVQERGSYAEQSNSERINVPVTRRVQQKKVNARPVSKFQILQSTEDGEIKAYHLPTRNY